MTGTVAEVPYVVNGNFLGLDNNRISGLILPSLQSAANISILQNNIFSCYTEVPVNDPGAKDYSCGSVLLETSISISVIVSLIVVICIVAYLLHFGLFQHLLRWYNLSKSDISDLVIDGDSSIRFLSTMLEKFRYFVLIVVLYIVLVLMPAYWILSIDSKTFTYQYGWLVGEFFFHGLAAGVVQFLLFLVLIIVIDRYSSTMTDVDRMWKTNVRDLLRHSSFKTESTKNSNIEGIRWFKEGWISYPLFFSANFIIVGCANYLYFYVITNYGKDASLFAILFLGLFKAIYKKFIILSILRYSKQAAASIKYRSLGPEESREIIDLSKNNLFVCSILQIINNIMIPWFIVLADSKQCFYGRISGTIPISGSQVTFCSTRCPGGLECCVYDTMETQFYFTPPFMYYSNCSNFLLTSYIPTFFTTFTFSGYVFPALLILQDWFLTRYHEPMESPTVFESLCCRFAKFQLRAKFQLTYITPVQQLSSCDSPPAVLDINQSLLTWTTSLGIIFSFGVFYPPLAILGMLTIVLDTVIVQIEIGRLIDRKDSFDQKHFTKILQVLSTEAYGLTTLIRSLAWAPGFFGTWIYCFVMFDTISDTFGINNGLIVALLWFFAAVSFKGGKRLISLYKKRLNRMSFDCTNPLNHRVATSVEMSDNTIVSAQDNPIL